MITLIKVIKETADVLRDSSQSSQSAIVNKSSIHLSFQEKKSWVWETQNHVCAFYRLDMNLFNMSQNAQTWFFALKLLF